MNENYNLGKYGKTFVTLVTGFQIPMAVGFSKTVFNGRAASGLVINDTDTFVYINQIIQIAADCNA